MNMIAASPSEIRRKLLDKWDKGYYLKRYREIFPLSVPLGTITSRQMTDSYNDVRNWILTFQENEKIAPFLQWEEINHRLFGRNRIPRFLVF